FCKERTYERYKKMIFDRKLILEDGSEYYGRGFGAKKDAVSEIVFNTSMVGYQEIISDPSYTDQTVVMADVWRQMECQWKSRFLNAFEEILHKRIKNAEVGGDFADAFATEIAVVFRHVAERRVGGVGKETRVDVAERDETARIGGANVEHIFWIHERRGAFGSHFRQEAGGFDADFIITRN
ncbi:MAG: hypothetical protein II381_11820, partial [Victivallales bacterium]|nr:hypothetical protein [Victivallales bacterium]